jgi:ubiquitin carboxyl-terminal hydrolase 8
MSSTLSLSTEKYKNKGLSGLSNLGNTCFINSCMQVISHTYELNAFLESEKYKKKLQNNSDAVLLLEWDNLRKILWSENCIVSPGKFIKTIQKVAHLKGAELFTGYSQNDITEFLLFIINCFHTAIAREITMTISGTAENETDNIATACFEMVKKMYSKEYSEIWNLFFAVHVSEITSLQTNARINITPEPFFMIDLPIPSNNKSPNLINCFDLYVDGEILEGENGWFNETTKSKEDVRKKILFWSLPNILVISFKRFNYKNQKNQIPISFPFDNLDLSNYVIGYKKNSYVYNLYGVCNHSGNVLGGHYTSYVKNANEKWYHYNDTNVSEVGVIDSIVSPKAYCLFYRKKQQN